MSFIVKGFDIPNDAVFFKLSFYNEDGDMEYGVHGSLKPYIIQIPKGHGDIKDINTFLKDKCLTEYIENDVFNKKYSYTIGTGAIYNAPTILKAEE